MIGPRTASPTRIITELSLFGRRPQFQSAMPDGCERRISTYPVTAVECLSLSPVFTGWAHVPIELARF